jgi:Transposase DDE domain
LWTDKNRAKYNRNQLRYPSDLTDDERFDAGKLIKGKKRHILVDMQGLLLHAIVHSAGIHDRDGGIWLLATLSGQFPFLAKLFADSAYAGSIFHTALAKVSPNLKTEVIKRSDRAKGFVPLPKPLPPTGQGLGESQSQRSRLPQTRFHPPHVTKVMQSLIKSPDGL